MADEPTKLDLAMAELISQAILEDDGDGTVITNILEAAARTTAFASAIVSGGDKAVLDSTLDGVIQYIRAVGEEKLSAGMITRTMLHLRKMERQAEAKKRPPDKELH